MNTAIDPKNVHAPLGAYHHAFKVPAGSELLLISGQVGVHANGDVAKGIGPQTEQAFRNILACLDANGMTAEHLVKLTIFLVNAGDVAAMRAARTKILGEAIKPASTLLVISALASPEFLVEIEAIAAK